MKPIEGIDKEAAVAFPIVGGGDVSGSIVMLLNDNGSCPTQTETKLAQIAAQNRDHNFGKGFVNNTAAFYRPLRH